MQANAALLRERVQVSGRHSNLAGQFKSREHRTYTAFQKGARRHCIVFEVKVIDRTLIANEERPALRATCHDHYRFNICDTFRVAFN